MMKNKFVALTILGFALLTGAAVTVEVLTLYPDVAAADGCASGASCTADNFEPMRQQSVSARVGLTLQR